MPSRLLSTNERKRARLGETSSIVNLRFTFKNAPISILERLTFDKPYEVLSEIHAINHVDECLLLQTCNRVEIYLATSERYLIDVAKDVSEYWLRRSIHDREEFYKRIEKSFNSEALIHLLRLTSGLESMIIGEDQILGQVQKAYEEAIKGDIIGQVLKMAFEKAIKTGRKVRNETMINKGAVSIGSAAVELLEKDLGSLKDKEILIIGAGEAGSLVGKALAYRKKAVIFIANRTYARSIRLAKMLDGCAVRFDEVKDLLARVDAAIVATSAPHYVLTKSSVEEVLRNRFGKELLILDLSQPRNVEEGLSDLPKVKVRSIDNLHGIAQVNLEIRLEEIKKAEALVNSELRRLELMLKRKRAEPVVSSLCRKAEEARCKELRKALKMIGEIDDKQRRVINDLTRVLVERVLYDPILNIREATLNDDLDTLSIVQKIFNLNSIHEEK